MYSCKLASQSSLSWEIGWFNERKRISTISISKYRPLAVYQSELIRFYYRSVNKIGWNDFSVLKVSYNCAVLKLYFSVKHFTERGNHGWHLFILPHCECVAPLRHCLWYFVYLVKENVFNNGMMGIWFQRTFSSRGHSVLSQPKIIAMFNCHFIAFLC